MHTCLLRATAAFIIWKFPGVSINADTLGPRIRLFRICCGPAASSWRPIRDMSSSDNCEQELWIDQISIDQGNEVERSKQIPLMGKSTSNLERFYLVRGGESRYRFCLGAGSNDEQAHLRLGYIAAWRPNLPMPFERIAKGQSWDSPHWLWKVVAFHGISPARLL